MIVEDGNGLIDANSYVSVAFADLYFADRSPQWQGDVSVKERALVKATDYIDSKYFFRLPGRKSKRAQALQWPRVAVPESVTGLPAQLLKACCEYALIALTQGELAPLPTYDQSGKVLSVSKKKVGPLEISYSDSESKQFQNSSNGPWRVYPVPDMLMEQLMLSAGAGLSRNRCYR